MGRKKKVVKKVIPKTCGDCKEFDKGTNDIGNCLFFKNRVSGFIRVTAFARGCTNGTQK